MERWESVGRGLGALFGPLKVVLNRRILLIGLAVVLLTFLVSHLESDYFENRHVYERLSATYEQFEELQHRGITEVSAEDFKQFQAETLAWLEPTIESLEAKAERKPASKRHWFGIGSASARARWNLLGAAKDLKAMVAHTTVPTTRGEAFARRMDKASDYLNRVSPSDVDPESADQLAGLDSTTIAVLAVDLAVDAVLVAGGFFYWIRRRKA